MIPVLDTEGMKVADRETIEGLGLPSLVLMETAAWSVTDAVLQRFPAAGRVIVVCGPGNNGGDGLACARQLHCRGIEVEAVLIAGPDTIRGDAATQLELAGRFGVPLRRCTGDDLGELQSSLAGSGVVVDALFGTGLDRPLEGRPRAAVELVNASGLPVVAVDIPSGLSGSRSHLLGESIEAQLTVALAAPKIAHLLPPACLRCGEVAVADIGIPPSLLNERAAMHVLEAHDVAGWLPPRREDAHKGHFGHLGIIAGRVGRAGAAALAARAAVVGGAGLVTVGIPAGAVSAVQAAVLEAMVDPLPEDGDGAPTGDGLGPLLGKVTALAVGPGIGLGEGSRRLLETIVAEWRGPLVLDADALTLLSPSPEALAGRAAATLLTPHPGELARLLDVEVGEVVRDRVAAARTLAQRSGCVVLAKGARTVIVDGEKVSMVNPTGTAGLASGGAGDTLTGLAGALLAQGLGVVEAAATAAYLHGLAAEIAAEDYPGAVPASVVGETLGEALAEVLEEL